MVRNADHLFISKGTQSFFDGALRSKDFDDRFICFDIRSPDQINAVRYGSKDAGQRGLFAHIDFDFAAWRQALRSIALPAWLRTRFEPRRTEMPFAKRPKTACQN